MHARTLLNLFLLVVAAALAATILLTPGLDDSNVATAITTIDPQQVKRIILQRADTDTLEFSRHVDSWRITGNPALPADDFQVHTVLALLEAVGLRSYRVDVLDDLGALGLDPPQASVTFDETRIDVGATDAIEGLRYLRIGNTVHLVADRFQHLPNAGFSNFVNRALLPDNSAIHALQLPGLTLTQTDGVNWQLQPQQPDASADAIDALIGTWERSTALYVRRLDTTAGIPEHAETILVSQGNSRPVEFRILAHAPDLVLARPEWGIQYHLPGTLATELLVLTETADTIMEPAEPDDMPQPDSDLHEADAMPADDPDDELPEPSATVPQPAM